MFNLKKRPRTKKLEEFELLQINLIKDSPLEYAYVMHKSNRVIQKENKESIMEILENPYSAEYVKLGPERDFELTESIPELRQKFAKLYKKKARSGLISTLIFVIIICLTILIHKANVEEIFSPLGITIMIYFLGTTAFQFYKLSKFKKCII